MPTLVCLVAVCSYGPRLYSSQWYRWFTSLLIYDNFVHLATNLFIFGVLSLHLEWRYGTWRTFLLALISGLGGNLFSASFEVGFPPHSCPPARSLSLHRYYDVWVNCGGPSH